MQGQAEQEKAAAGRAAVREVRSGIRLGLGTGSTVRHFLDALAEALEAGEIDDIVGVSTSEETERRCRELGIPTTDPIDGSFALDLAVDGADEVDPSLDLIKGLGGALLREKIVVEAAARFVVIVDSAKRVTRLGTRSPLPVEVVPFGWRNHLEPFEAVGARPVLRTRADGAPYLTDNGNLVLDLHFAEGIHNPLSLDRTLRGRTGVVGTGLFTGCVDEVFIGTPSGVERLRRDAALHSEGPG